MLPLAQTKIDYLLGIPLFQPHHDYSARIMAQRATEQQPWDKTNKEHPLSPVYPKQQRFTRFKCTLNSSIDIVIFYLQGTQLSSTILVGF